MGLLRWLRRAPPPQEEHSRKGRARFQQEPEVFKIQVDNEYGSMSHSVSFSFWSAVKHILILSLLLWWLPTFGQMIAGYVGGRRAGTSWRAVWAAIIPLLVIFAINATVSQGVLTAEVDVFASLPYLIATAISKGLPFTSPYMIFAMDYLTTFVDSMKNSFSMGVNGYLVTVVFAYVGGSMAELMIRQSPGGVGAQAPVGITIAQPIFQRAHLFRDRAEHREFHPAPVVTRKRSRHPVLVASDHGTSHRHIVRRAHPRIWAHPELAPVHHRRRRKPRRYEAVRFESLQRLNAREVERERIERERRPQPRLRPRPEISTVERAQVHEHRPSFREEKARQVERVQHSREAAVQKFVERALRNYPPSGYR